MATWTSFADEAPEIADLAARRIAATGLLMLGTLRRDGFPRISPVEPTLAGDRLVLHDDRLWLGMMPGSTKSRDLQRDGRLALHTATADKDVSEGDVKLWGEATLVDDRATLQQMSDDIFASVGHRFEVGEFDAFDIDLQGASAVTVDVEAEVMFVRTWRPGAGVTTVEKH
jgi:pyridoxamine 5'-phosphate oxidase-like protein